MHIILAASFDASTFWGAGLGLVIADFMKVFAILLTLGAVVKVAREAAGGKAGSAAKTLVGALVVVAFLWDPILINDVIGLFANIVGQGVNQANTLTGGNSTR
jgi:hypothetical protein